MGARREIQVKYTELNQEWFNPGLREVMMDVEYPLHFIDFETFRTAVPYHRGMRPFELMAFQWSCHTVRSLGEEPIHGEWLNLEKKVPNLGFAESLRNFVGDNGTLLIWSDYETTTLKPHRPPMRPKRRLLIGSQFRFSCHYNLIFLFRLLCSFRVDSSFI